MVAEKSFDLLAFGLWAHHTNHCATLLLSLLIRFLSNPATSTYGRSRLHIQRPAAGYIAQWLERLTADQQVLDSNPGVPSFMADASGRLVHTARFIQPTLVCRHDQGRRRGMSLASAVATYPLADLSAGHHIQ